MRTIEVQFKPGERVIVRPRGFELRTGIIHKVTLCAGGCIGYTVRCQDNGGAIYTLNCPEAEIAAIPGEG